MWRGSDVRGFTLLEVTVALAILGLVLVGAFAAEGADLRASRKAADSVEAAALAEHLLARMELLPPDEFARLFAGEEGWIEPPLDRYRWHAAARPIPGESELAEVRVTLDWPGGSLAVDTRLRRPLSDPFRPTMQ